MGGVRLDLLPQAADVDHQGVLIPHHGAVPEGGAQGVDGDDVPPVVRQLFQKGELLGGEGDLPLRTGHGAGPPVDGGRAQGQGVVRLPPAVHPAQHRPQPQEQLLGEKGLCDVVVRPQAQALEPGRVLVPGGQVQHRHVPEPPQLRQEGEPVPVGEHHVQQHRVRPPGRHGRPGLGAVGGLQDLIARPGEQAGHHPPQLGLVVHQ